jgi:hypothetical protein
MKLKKIKVVLGTRYWILVVIGNRRKFLYIFG